MNRPTWAPTSVDLNQPSIARIYDYFLGGFHNFKADRVIGEQTMRALPEIPMITQTNRAFLRRAVRWLVDQGITQFLDLGSGIPTSNNVHEVAQGANPEAKIVYVDLDPVAVLHSQKLLEGNDRAIAFQADMRKPTDILDDPEVRQLLDFDQPIGLLMVAVLQFVPDTDDPFGLIARYRDALAPGSYLAISHPSKEGLPKDRMDAFDEVYAKSVTQLTWRNTPDIVALFEGFELVEPGVVPMGTWHPDGINTVSGPATFGPAGVGRKP